MSGHDGDQGFSPDEEIGEEAGAERPRRRRDPVGVLTIAMVVYVFVTALLALPLVFAPSGFFDVIGLPPDTAADLGGLRWMGAVLLAWAVSGMLVLARPSGRAIFVTTGALQLTFAAVAFLYSWSVGEFEWSGWYHAVTAAILIAGSLVMWWARFVSRKVFRGLSVE